MHMYTHIHTKCFPKRWEGKGIWESGLGFLNLSPDSTQHTLSVFRASPAHWSVLTDRQTWTHRKQLGLCLGKTGQKLTLCFYKMGNRVWGSPRPRTSASVGTEE